MSPIPSALDAWPQVAQRLASGTPALFLDFDGTLSPIVSRPGDAALLPGLRPTLATLAGRYPVAVISGRDLDDVAARVGLTPIWYAGSHGLDIRGPGLRHQAIPEAQAVAAEVAEHLRGALADIDGALVEPKRFSVAVHVRLVAPESVSTVRGCVDRALADRPSLRLLEGKCVFDLRPAARWNKGDAVRWLLEHIPEAPRPWVPVVIGDDITDVDALAAVGPEGIPIWVGVPPAAAQAVTRFRLADPDEVRTLLERIAALSHT